MTDKPQRLYGWTDPNANPSTLYTDSTTLTIGMSLYDNTGIDTGSTVDIINQDGTFDVNSEPLYYCYIWSGVGAYLYSSKLITNTGDHTFLSKSDGTKATNTSQLTMSMNLTVNQIISNGFYDSQYYQYLYSQADDLYT